LRQEFNEAVNLDTVEELDKWADPFITKMAQICKPNYFLDFRMRKNPQEEESKDEVGFDQKLAESVDQFTEVVVEYEREIKADLFDLEKKY
jgi:hypothetical protein